MEINCNFFINTCIIFLYMKKLLFFLTLLILVTLPVLAQPETIQTEVSTENFPDELFGSWRIIAKLDKTNNYRIFKPQSTDIWNISRVGENVILENYYTGAKAKISLKTVEGSLIVFSKINPFDNKIFTDTVRIRLDKNHFTGVNTVVLETFSLIDNHLLKTETARYHIKGEKINDI